ncbi:winged helix-turn-helix transcriptional regulator [Macrococcus equipercicus]|uniref:Winged helix-turn-helix transcriptional regulator n=1 Tax=Macrococcus equipercicus TaxID=69967 RepID=A0ABQ6R6X0_9STAP|nr:metalloregulator ArsR/SmtB family transcription factor [Macrococcus equipercicus]KAA1037605.1 winged helix-turn-helix transcriptional regulator [Macrococcus equipercicus]
MDYERLSAVFKVLSDRNRLEIIDLLSCGPLCACDILKHFNVTQPTLSHHMKQLKDMDIVTSWKEGTRVMYALNRETTNRTMQFIEQLFTDNTHCVCDQITKESCCES